VAIVRSQAVKLARALRDLRESANGKLTQAQLATAFGMSAEGGVAAATLSSWESTTNPKTPSKARLRDYALFFCSPRSLEGQPHLLSVDELSDEERRRFEELESKLIELSSSEEHGIRHGFRFKAGPIVVVCATLPEEDQGRLANEDDPNFNRLQQYGDVDALIELYGHLRAENPTLDVFHRIADDVVSDDLSSHLVLLGGVTWNRVTRRIQSALSRIPIEQIEVDDFKTGEIFRVRTAKLEEEFRPEYQDFDGEREQIADVGYIVRRRSPYQTDRTLTICNGVHSRGVFGAVRCLTDKRVRDENERYLADRFPNGEFAMLVRVPLVANETISPDLRNPDTRLFEWGPTEATE
jgi:transcriptional regulator with XRE-family HTH domain